jgi:hypothetical protein
MTAGLRVRLDWPLMPDAELDEVFEKSKDFQEPKNHYYDYNGIQYSLDLTLHRDIAVDQP